MNKTITFILFAATVILLFNCHTIEITDTSKKPSGMVQEEGWYKSYLFGIIESNKQYGTVSSCENGVAKAVMQNSCMNILGQAVLGVCYVSPYIISFRSNEIHCARAAKKSTDDSDDEPKVKKNKK